MKKGEIWLARLPEKGGREQQGERPVVVVGGIASPLAIIVPLTSSRTAAALEFTLPIPASEANSLHGDSVALVFQLQAIDPRRFQRSIGQLEPHHIREIHTQLKRLLLL